MTTTEIRIVEQGFTAAMSPWAAEFAEDYDWDGIRDEYNARLDELAPEGVSWGWSESGPWCYADTSVPAESVHERWAEIQSEQLIDFETIASHHEVTR